MDSLGVVEVVADTIGGVVSDALLANVKSGGTYASVVGPPPNAKLYPAVKVEAFGSGATKGPERFYVVIVEQRVRGQRDTRNECSVFSMSSCQSTAEPFRAVRVELVRSRPALSRLQPGPLWTRHHSDTGPFPVLKLLEAGMEFL